MNGLRQATFEDVGPLFRVRYAVRENTLRPGVITDDDVRREISETGRGWVVEAEGRVEAFAIGNAVTGNIWALFVHPDFEGRGFGSRLHDEMVRWLFSRGLDTLWLTTAPDSRAEAFYRRRGWSETGRTEKGELRFELRATEPVDSPAQSNGDPGISRETPKSVATLTTANLVLEPLTVAHAHAMFAVLSDLEIYRYLDYPPPPSLDYLLGIYGQLEAGKSPEGDEIWLNWIVREPGGPPMGFVQATVLPDASAWVAYVLSSRHWGKGHAFAATNAMIEHLREAHGIESFMATVEAGNSRSIGLLERLSFRLASAQEAQGHDLTATERLYLR